MTQGAWGSVGKTPVQTYTTLHNRLDLYLRREVRAGLKTSDTEGEHLNRVACGELIVRKRRELWVEF